MSFGVWTLKAIDLGGHEVINVRCGLGQVLPVKGAGILSIWERFNKEIFMYFLVY